MQKKSALFISLLLFPLMLSAAADSHLSWLRRHLPNDEAYVETLCTMNILNNTTESPLLKAAEEENSELVQRLLSAGALVPKNNPTIKKAILKFLDHGKNNVIIDLIKAGADVNTKDDDNITLLKRSVHRVDIHFTRALLELNADPNIADNQGYTPLMIACTPECRGTISAGMLIAAGADPFKVNRDNTQALDIAKKRHDDPDLILLIEQHIANTVKKRYRLLITQMLCAQRRNYNSVPFSLKVIDQMVRWAIIAEYHTVPSDQLNKYIEEVLNAQ